MRGQGAIASSEDERVNDKSLAECFLRWLGSALSVSDGSHASAEETDADDRSLSFLFTRSQRVRGLRQHGKWPSLLACKGHDTNVAGMSTASERREYDAGVRRSLRTTWRRRNSARGRTWHATTCAALEQNDQHRVRLSANTEHNRSDAPGWHDEDVSRLEDSLSSVRFDVFEKGGRVQRGWLCISVGGGRGWTRRRNGHVERRGVGHVLLGLGRAGSVVLRVGAGFREKYWRGCRPEGGDVGRARWRRDPNPLGSNDLDCVMDDVVKSASIPQ